MELLTYCRRFFISSLRLADGGLLCEWHIKPHSVTLSHTQPHTQPHTQRHTVLMLFDCFSVSHFQKVSKGRSRFPTGATAVQQPHPCTALTAILRRWKKCLEARRASCRSTRRLTTSSLRSSTTQVSCVFDQRAARNQRRSS